MRRRGVLLEDDDRMSVGVGIKLRRVEGGFVPIEDEADNGTSSSGPVQLVSSNSAFGVLLEAPNRYAAYDFSAR
ncbi:hypothetical protein P691DRAFT_767140 [Macrolepiota fuliginosa MF-IS2]|uniref:Uncharacterized protein n=1 Tax=Macrolepiota fuliginosa MF-IS2 TaxID=1400762 RepID=A0A9P6BUX0_9AGAR|nr:hypothetical protein P691DRAFT_767140 [Macrolepiota fuliginosa MF-IS2]